MSTATTALHSAPSREPRSLALTTQPNSAVLVWLAVSAGVIILLALFFARQSTLLRIAVPSVSAMIALALYLRRPVGYLHFTLWVWFLAPLVRRLIDWRFGFEDQNVVLLTPGLVTSIAVVTLIRERHKARDLQLIPFLLCFGGILYGFLVGVLRWQLDVSKDDTLTSMVYGLFMWLTPLLFGLHIYLRWQDYEQHRRAIQKSFTLAVLILGVYGVSQYIYPPTWDCAWLEGLPGGYENASFGRPLPYEVRVWSTSNSPGTFATIMLAGLILLTVARSRLKLMTSAAGYAAFLLSMVRTAWIAWVLAMIILAVGYRGAKLRRFILGILLLPLCLLPFLFNPDIQHAIQERLMTMQNAEQDGSLQDRQRMYRAVTAELLQEPSGMGLHNSSTIEVDGFALDSGLLQTALMLGLTGTALYGGGLTLAVVGALKRSQKRRSESQRDAEFPHRAIIVVTLLELIAGNVFVNISGIILWTSLALLLSFNAHARAAAAPNRRSSTVRETSTH